MQYIVFVIFCILLAGVSVLAIILAFGYGLDAVFGLTDQPAFQRHLPIMEGEKPKTSAQVLALGLGAATAILVPLLLIVNSFFENVQKRRDDRVKQKDKKR